MKDEKLGTLQNPRHLHMHYIIIPHPLPFHLLLIYLLLILYVCECRVHLRTSRIISSTISVPGLELQLSGLVVRAFALLGSLSSLCFCKLKYPNVFRE